MILAGDLQFYQLEKSWLKKIQLWMGLQPMHPRYSLGAATNWARKPHAGSEENFRGFTFFVEENLCSMQWDNSNRATTDPGELKFNNYRIGRKNNRKKKRLVIPLSRICPAQNVRGVEQSRNNSACFFSISKNALSTLWLAWRNYQIQGQVVLFGPT